MRNTPVVFLKYQQSQAMSHKETKEANDELEHSYLQSEAILTKGSAPDEPEVEDGKVTRLDEATLVVCRDLEKTQSGKEA